MYINKKQWTQRQHTRIYILYKFSRASLIIDLTSIFCPFGLNLFNIHRVFPLFVRSLTCLILQGFLWYSMESPGNTATSWAYCIFSYLFMIHISTCSFPGLVCTLWEAYHIRLNVMMILNDRASILFLIIRFEIWREKIISMLLFQP